MAQDYAVLLASLLPVRRRTHYILGVGYGTAMAASSMLPLVSSFDREIYHARRHRSCRPSNTSLHAVLPTRCHAPTSHRYACGASV